MNVLIATMPAIGHVNPLRPIARELGRRGHQVHWWTGPAFAEIVTDTGARFLDASDAAPIMDIEAIEARYPERAALSGFAKLRWDLERVFLDPIPTQVWELRRLTDLLRTDLIVSDIGLMGAGVLHEVGGPCTSPRAPWPTPTGRSGATHGARART